MGSWDWVAPSPSRTVIPRGQKINLSSYLGVTDIMLVTRAAIEKAASPCHWSKVSYVILLICLGCLFLERVLTGE